MKVKWRVHGGRDAGGLSLVERLRSIPVGAFGAWRLHVSELVDQCRGLQGPQLGVVPTTKPYQGLIWYHGAGGAHGTLCPVPGMGWSIVGAVVNSLHRGLGDPWETWDPRRVSCVLSSGTDTA